MNESGTHKNPPNTCPQCGAALPSAALEGLCPACLLKQGAETGPSSESVPFQPPGLEEVARLFPQLQILAFIGKGGMGAVYQARQPVLDRLVALKILPPQAAGGPGFAERFNREARALARLNHPNIVAVHEFGQAGGSPFFIMEFVDGLTLRQLERAGRLSPAEALRIVPQICEALQFAHDEGIVHRDIKPENILIDKKGRVKIADFGIAKIIGGGAAGRAASPLPAAGAGENLGPSGAILPDDSLTETRHALGTPHYMAPEQVETPQTVDHRADIFSLGVVFYEMLTGHLPLGKFSPPSRSAQIDVRLDEVVLRALEREPELRYQQAGDVKTQIDTISSTPSGEHRLPRESKAVRSPGGFPRSRGQIFAWIAVSFVIVGMWGYFLLIPRVEDEMGLDDAAALAFSGVAFAIALAFGVLSWRERIGKVIAIALLVLSVLLVLPIRNFLVAARSLRQASPQAAARAAELAGRDSGLQRSTLVRAVIQPPMDAETVAQARKEAELKADLEASMAAFGALRKRVTELEDKEAKLEANFNTNSPIVQTNRIEISSAMANAKAFLEEELKRQIKKLTDAETAETDLEKKFQTNSPEILSNLRTIESLKAIKKAIEARIAQVPAQK